jgi:5'-3' exonuclease
VTGSRVVQFDRRKRELRDEAGVIAKFGVKPASIPDYLGLVGDSSDGFPGLAGWGAKSAATVLAKFECIEDIPDNARDWGLSLRSADVLAKTLRENRDLALLFKDLATLRCDVPLFSSVDDLAWNGVTPEFDAFCQAIDAKELSARAASLGSRSSA